MFSRHAEARIAERLSPVCRIAKRELLRLVESEIPRAVSIGPGGKHRRIIAVPVQQFTVYLVVTFRGNGMFVITCLTPEMVAQQIDERRKTNHCKDGRSKRLPPGRPKNRRGGHRDKRGNGDW